ncbi:MAG: TldD/PmbA family protein [Clostridiales bacterium]|nr:TldD/PmbA family protein [Clostridiales bacterium]
MRKLFDHICSQVDDAELYIKRDDIISIDIKQGVVKAVDGKNVVGLSLRMNNEGKAGTAVSTSLEDKSIVERAIISSQYQTGDLFNFKHIPSEPVVCFDEVLVRKTSEELILLGKTLNDRIKAIDDTIIFAISVIRTISDVSIINTAGLDDSYNKSQLTISIETMSDAGFVQTSITESYSKFFEISDELLKDLVHKHQISTHVYEVETSRMPVVFSGRAMGSLMTRLLAGVNGEFISKGVSPLENKLGNKVASDILSVTDEGRLSHGFQTMKFDDEGIPTQRTRIIEKGVLKNFMVSVSTEEKLGCSATGNAQKKTMFSKEIEDQPVIDSTNFMIEPGVTSDDEIINGISHGIYVDSVMGTHTGNIPAGEYALNVGIGYLIKDGKLVGKVVDSMVSGNIYEDMFKIEAVGKKLELMNVVFYPMGYSPMVKFSDINVIGSK